MAEQLPGRERRASINPAGARPQLCVILGRRGGYSEHRLGQLLREGKAMERRDRRRHGLQEGTPPFWGEEGERGSGPPERWMAIWKMRFKCRGGGVGLCPNPCCLEWTSLCYHGNQT